MNVAPKSVKRTLLIGVGSGITSPLGMAAGLTETWATLIFVTREPYAMAQVVRAIDSIVLSDERCLQGGAVLHLTARNFQWPHEELLMEIPGVLAGKRSWASLLAVYEEYATLAHWMFREPAPSVEGKSLDDFFRQLQLWLETHDFSHPHERIRVRLGRPDWTQLLDELQHEAIAVPDTMSFVPEPLQIRSVAEASVILLELHCLYCGSRPALASVRKYVDRNNRSLYGGNQGDRHHMILHEEVFG
jgi:hypothetical protein